LTIPERLTAYSLISTTISHIPPLRTGLQEGDRPLVVAVAAAEVVVDLALDLLDARSRSALAIKLAAATVRSSRSAWCDAMMRWRSMVIDPAPSARRCLPRSNSSRPRGCARPCPHARAGSAEERHDDSISSSFSDRPDRRGRRRFHRSAARMACQHRSRIIAASSSRRSAGPASNRARSRVRTTAGLLFRGHDRHDERPDHAPSPASSMPAYRMCERSRCGIWNDGAKS